MIRRGWAIALGVLALVVFGANGILLYYAVSDPSFAVEENYYQKALDWDTHREQDRHNDELGWTLAFDLGKTRSPDGSLRLTATLADDRGRAIDDARVRVTAFHNARAAFPLDADLRPAGDGAYAVGLPLRRPGLWEFRFEVASGGERFTLTRMREVAWIR